MQGLCGVTSDHWQHATYLAGVLKIAPCFFASQQHSAAFMLHVLNSVLQHTDAQDAQHMTVPGASKQQACTKQQ